MADTKKPFHETVAEKLIEQLKAGTAPWQRPWQAGEPAGFVPFNPTTSKRYKGINAIHLLSQGRPDPRWMTYRQAAALGAQVRQGEKGTPIQYWKFSEEQLKTDAAGRPVLDARGEPVKQTVQLERPRVFFATVFNAGQIDGLPPVERKARDWNAVERAEQILQASGAVIRHGEQDRAFYRLSSDSIHLPDKARFGAADAYYATALHELGHWTGHPSRLGRDIAHPFGSAGYAREELRAEIASMLLGDELGIGHDPGQHAAYVGSWIKALQDDPLEVFRAAADAEKILGYVLGLEQKHLQEQDRAQQQVAEATVPTITDPIAELMDELRELHLAAVPGYSPLESWDNLKATAEQHGLVASIWRGSDSETEPPYAIAYADGSGDPTAITTYLYADGKALTHFAGQRIAGTGYTSDTEWQSAALEAAVTQERSRVAAHREAATAREQDMQQAREGAVDSGPNEVRMPAKVESVDRPGKTFIAVPFTEKDEARALGARWDRREQSWYVPAGNDLAPFGRWTQQSARETTEGREAVRERHYLAVPYGEHVAARAAGALWDKAAKSWYAGPKADPAKLERWRPDNVPSQQAPAMTPREEFAQVLRSLGCAVDGAHPVMDGATHRIGVDGDRKGEQAGFYVAHLDGHPAGYIKNNRTGIETKWKSKGYSLSAEERAKLQAEAAAKRQAREAEQARLHEQTALRLRRQLAELVPAVQPTPYLRSKGIVEPQPGVFTDHEGQKTYLPATDADGRQWTTQVILADGTKRFAKDSRKEGCFHAVGGLEALARAPALVIAEGYATAASLAQSLGFAAVAAFDSGNLPHVARALHDRFPDKPVVIAGDDDRHLEATQGVNPGRQKAQEAAGVTGGKALLPIFAPGEQAADPKGFTDFNDLANKSELGREGIDRQVRCVVESVIGKQQASVRQDGQERGQRLALRPRRATAIG